MPITTFGELKIVPSADIGELGPSEGTIITYNWMWYNNVTGLFLWIALLSAILFVKANRNRHVLLIFIPIFLVYFLSHGFFKLLNAPSAEASQMGIVITSYATGLSALWLLAQKFKSKNNFVTFFFAFVVAAGFAIIGLISNSGWDLDMQGILFLLIQIIMIFAVLLAFILARRGCRKRYSGIKFMLFLALWMLVICIVGMFAFYFILLGIQGVSIEFEVILVASIAGLVVGLICYFVNLPFMILGFVSPFFRERFYTCLHLKPIPISEVQSSDNNLSGNGPDSKIPENSDF